MARRSLSPASDDNAESPPRISGYRVLTGGCWNRVIALGVPEAGPAVDDITGPFAGMAGNRAKPSEVILKISPHENDGDIIREYHVLSRFAELSDFPVPRPLYLDAPAGRMQVLPGTTLVMTKIPGRVMHSVFGRLSPGERSRVLDQLTEDVIRLHRKKADGFGGVELPDDKRLASWPRFWLPRLEEVLKAVRDAGVLPEGVFSEVAELWPFLEELLDIGTESTLTHYDIWAGNVMIDPGDRQSGAASGASISGYIDIPGNWADYAWEISFMQVFGLADEPFLRRYAEAHGLDESFEERLRAYQLRTFMKHVMMYPRESYYRQGTELCLDSLRRGAAAWR